MVSRSPSLAGTEFYVGRIGEMPMNVAVPFGRGLRIAPAPDGFYHSEGGEFDIAFHDATGALRRRVRADVPRIPVSGGARDSIRAQWSGPGADGYRAAMRDLYADVPLPEYAPSIGSLATDEDGNLWVQLPGRAETPREWLVFDSTGVLIASAETPASLDIRRIGSSSVLGIARDSLDVESVREHAIVRDE